MENLLRRVRNSQRSNIAFKDGSPSKNTITEGEELMAIMKNKGLSLFRKQKGILWWINFTKDGNENFEKDLKVNGNIKADRKIQCGDTFVSSDGFSGMTATKTITTVSQTHTVKIKDGLITSWVIT